ncbi:MAG: 2-phospho-L-lactate guanylyltransferase, partial [Actinomycetota bacterium]|nr:2-phospho-L-lactate guanylyltransferase [Actinomycetota bacterium]
MDAGLLPVKSLHTAKSRLAESYGESGRRALAVALLRDAFELMSSTDFLAWWVVSDDGDVLADATTRGFHAVRDPGTGLNDALQAGIEAIVRSGADSVTVVPADVPLAWAGDLRDLIDTGATSDVVVVPSGDGGTNGLYLSPPTVMTPAFGPDSFRAHLSAAADLRLRCSILSLARLELDIDSAADVDALKTRPRRAHSHTMDAV